MQKKPFFYHLSNIIFFSTIVKFGRHTFFGKSKQLTVSQKCLKYSENWILDFFWVPVKMHLKFHMQKEKGLGMK